MVCECKGRGADHTATRNSLPIHAQPGLLSKESVKPQELISVGARVVRSFVVLERVANVTRLYYDCMEDLRRIILMAQSSKVRA